MVFAPFRSENGFRLFPCWSRIGYGFPQGTAGVYECQLSFQFQMNLERKNNVGNSKWISRNLFAGVLI